MKNEQFYRELFINNTIRLVAEGGFEMATTRAIAGDRREIDGIRVNEAHIYRVFGTKEILFAETFAMLDDELVSVIMEGLSVFDSKQDFQDQCYTLFLKVWEFLLQNEQKFRYYTRYYYSIYFKSAVQQMHRQKIEPLIEKITPVFVEKADVWAILYHVLSVLLSFALNVYGGVLENSEENIPHIFIVAYSSIALYLK